MYSHDQESADVTSDDEQLPAIYGRFHGGALGWFCQDSSTLLLLGNCGIGRSLEALMNPAGLTYGGSTILDLAHFHKNRYLRNRNVSKCAWTFPLASLDAMDEENESLIRAFFIVQHCSFNQCYILMYYLRLVLRLKVANSQGGTCLIAHRMLGLF